jgi:alkylated DNA repair protein (DNA oxidative demethylase)
MADTTATPPDGFFYHPDFIREPEERELLKHLEQLTFADVRMHGIVAKRRVLHFGWVYGYDTWRIVQGPPLPAFLHPLRERVASLTSIEAASFEQILVSHYPAGAGIGWHRDAPMFGPVVVGVSLLGTCRLRFCRRVGSQREAFSTIVERGSTYILSGASRFQWQHSIPATKESRYSITFRTVREASASAPARPQMSSLSQA